MRILHIADLHFDRAFEGLPQGQGLDFTALEQVNQKVWENILQIALQKKVDVVVFAGDTFHQVQASLKMQRIFFAGLQKLAQENIPVMLSFGNHDYYQENKFWFSFPENTYVFTDEKVVTKTLTLTNGEIAAFSSFSYTKPWITEGKVLEFPRRSTADYHIGIYHGELGQKNNYAPFQAGQLLEKNYDYWALGHIHKGQAVSDRAYYAGTPQGHHQKERENTGVLLVDLNGSQISIERILVAEVLWQAKTISLKNIRDIQQLGTGLLEKIMSEQTTEKTIFLQIEVTDFQQLGHEFERRMISGEVLSLLNQQLTAAQSPLRVTALNFSENVESASGLPISQSLLNQTIQLYQNQEIFSNTLGDLLENPDVRGVLTEDFQQQVLLEAQKLINVQEN